MTEANVEAKPPSADCVSELLSLVSPHILEDPHDVFDKMEEGRSDELRGFCFRQIQKFQKSEKDFRLRYEQTEQMSRQ